MQPQCGEYRTEGRFAAHQQRNPGRAAVANAIVLREESKHRATHHHIRQIAPKTGLMRQGQQGRRLDQQAHRQAAEGDHAGLQGGEGERRHGCAAGKTLGQANQQRSQAGGQQDQAVARA